MNSNIPEKLTANSIVAFLASEHDLDKKTAKKILEDFYTLVEEGILTGNKVPIGTIGKVYAHQKPATQERKGINPATREPIVIKAKPASQVPKFSFSKRFKERIRDNMPAN